MRRSRRTILTATAGLAALGLLLAACGDDDDSGGEATTTAAGSATTAGGDTSAPAGEAKGVIQFKALDAAGPLTFQALENGDIQIAAVFSSQGIIVANDWVVLEDDRGLQPVQNLVPVARSGVLSDEAQQVVGQVMAELTTEDLAALNNKVDVDKEEPEAAARGWLEENGLPDCSNLAVDGSYTVGSADFSEQQIVSAIVAQSLEACGAEVDRKFGIGSREIVAPALQSGDIDLYVEYVGAYLAYLKGTPSGDLETTLADLRTAASAVGVDVLDPAPAEDKDALAVTRETAERLNLTTISDLLNVSETLVMGGPPECPERPFCIQGYEKVYGLQFEV